MNTQVEPLTSPILALRPEMLAPAFQRGMMYQSSETPISGSGSVVEVLRSKGLAGLARERRRR